MSASFQAALTLVLATGLLAPAMALAGCGASSPGAQAPPAFADASLPDAAAPAVDASRPTIPATMNDVSILFPLPASMTDVDNLLAPSATGRQGTLVPSALYASAMDGSPDASPDADGYDGLRLTAMRIDPCFSSLAPSPDGTGCTAQIRLVFQAVAWSSGASGAADSGLHAFYDLTRGEFLALARALVELRIANANGETLGSLAPHPIMAVQGLSGPMSQGVQALVLEYAGEKNLVRLAQFGQVPNNGGIIWTMSAFDVGADKGVAMPSAIPTLAERDGGSVFADGIFFGAQPEQPDGGPLFFATFGATTNAMDDFDALDGREVESLSASARQAALDAVVRVENPRDTSANTVNCSTCHMATPTEKLAAMPLFSFDDETSPLAFQPDGTYVTPSDMAVMFLSPDDGQGDVFTIHAFSYFGASPGISRRVVNETAAIVVYLNELPP